MCYGYTRMLKHHRYVKTQILVIVSIKLCFIINIVLQKNIFMINKLTNIAFQSL